MRNRFLFVPLCLFALSASAAHVTEVVVKDFTGASPVAYRAELCFTATNLQFVTSSFTGSEAGTELLYHTKARKIWYLDHGDRSYVEIDEAIVSSMSEGFEKTVDILQAMMKRGGVAPSNRPSFKAVASGGERDLLGLPCEEYEVSRGEQKVQDVWLSSWDAARLPVDSFAAVRKLALASDQLLSALAGTPLLRGLPRIPLATIAGLDGYPVLIRQYDGAGKALYDIILQPPSEQEVEPARFKVPDGYRRTLM